MRERWVEPPGNSSMDLSTLTQQILSCLAETGGLRADELFRRLVSEGAFRDFDEELIARVLRSLGKSKLIEQAPDKTLILAPHGERVVHDLDFYSAFATGLEFSVRHEGRLIGTLPALLLPQEGDHLLLGGRRWQVEAIDVKRVEILVRPAHGKKPPRFLGGGGHVHERVRGKMREVLCCDTPFAYIDGTSSELLKEARHTARTAKLSSRCLLETANNTLLWFTWTGSKTQNTLRWIFECLGLTVTDHDVALEIPLSPQGLVAKLAPFSTDGLSAEDLAESTKIRELRKFDRFLDELLLVQSLAADHVDIEGASKLIGAALDEPSDSLQSEIASLVTTANEAIAHHHSTVDNLDRERKTLTQQVWRFLITDPLKDALASYDKTTTELQKAIQNLETQLRQKEAEFATKQNEIRKLERDTTSIQPTVDGINSLLRSFGFNGFSLAQADNKRCYKLVRSDGQDAKDTLSEGERTFITFLYFYHLLRGSASETGVTYDRVVVFDDPVSSLDSDILFIVSTLIRKVCDDVRCDSSTIKQVFVLTHNVYFHKEVTFNRIRRGGILSEESFWTVRKLNGQSLVEKHACNPVKSSYELLWLEVREAKVGSMSIQNSLRRILETYFKILGGIDLDRIHERFDGNEKLACRALLSWVNDGSHSAHDDLYSSVDETTVALYLDVFRNIFETEGHIEHYKMMMQGPSALPAVP